LSQAKASGFWSKIKPFGCNRPRFQVIVTSVAEPHHFYAAPAPAPGKNFDAAPAPAPAPTLLYSKAKLLKRTKVYTHVETILFI
jgi:hypothetical protein